LRTRSRLSFILLAGAALAAATPALAQFDSIFRDGPPRPPADVPAYPNDRSNDQRPYYQTPPAQPPRGPERPWRNPDLPPPLETGRQAPEQGAPRPPAGIADTPPTEPLPAPMSLPPASRPGGGTIQSQELPPPPGAQKAPPQPAQSPPGPGQPQQATAPNAAPQALPPGALPAPGAAPQPGPTPQIGSAPAAPPAPAAPGEPPAQEVVVEPPPQRIANPTAVFSGLDKITGRIISFDVTMNETVQFGALQVTPRVCYSRPPTETPNTDAFVEVDEVTLQGEIKRIFTGWMFAASPGLHAVEHPIYDVWLTECKGGQPPAVADASDAEAAKAAAKPARPQPARRPAPRAQRDQGFLPALR
jgi:hypothetical protein